MTKKDEWICEIKEIGKDASGAASNMYNAVSITAKAGGGAPAQTVALVASGLNEGYKMINNDRSDRVNTCVETMEKERNDYEASITYSMDQMKKTYIAPAPQQPARPDVMHDMMRPSGAPNHSYDPNFDPQANQICRIS